VIEKLLENWLDSASERSYQAVFVQMLTAEGYTVLHSTRHCLLEFGKDILAIAPDGVGCAFQLKGDPKGRMTIGTFRSEIQAQLLQLGSQSPQFPGFPAGVHRSFLVSNGQFEEEVQTAIAQMNMGMLPSKIHLWSRGHLVELCRRHGSSMWPSELSDNRSLLEIYLASPRGQLPAETLCTMLESILHLKEADSTLGAGELRRAAASAAWVTGISTAPFAEVDNHVAIAHAWTACCASLVAAEARHAAKPDPSLRATLSLAQSALLDSLAALWNEIRSAKTLVQGNPLHDSAILGWRVTVLLGLLTCLAIASEGSALLDEVSFTDLVQWLKQPPVRPELWGEGAVASLVVWLVWLRRHDPTARVDAEIAALAEGVIRSNQSDSNSPLSSPYYGYEEIQRHRLVHPAVHRASSLSSETVAGMSFTAESLMHLLVRTGLKQKCRSLWADFSRLNHMRLELDAPWKYGLRRAPGGVEVSMFFPPSCSWAQLKHDSLKETESSAIPQHFAATPWLLAALWQLHPHRLDRDALKLLIEGVVPRWGT